MDSNPIPIIIWLSECSRRATIIQDFFKQVKKSMLYATGTKLIFACSEFPTTAKQITIESIRFILDTDDKIIVIFIMDWLSVDDIWADEVIKHVNSPNFRRNKNISVKIIFDEMIINSRPLHCEFEIKHEHDALPYDALPCFSNAMMPQLGARRLITLIEKILDLDLTKATSPNISNDTLWKIACRLNRTDPII